jgi:hypothetical protein
MTKEEFNEFWAGRYYNSIPISHVFKRDYPERWLRIHSLPQSKRYAEDEIEWAILLQRQNRIISDIFGENLQVLLVTGTYSDKMGWESPWIEQGRNVLKPYVFTKLEAIDLYSRSSEFFEEDMLYTPEFAEIAWKVNRYDNLLKSIANDELRVFFVSPEKNVIIAPYDGGVDIILKDLETKEYYKSKYSQWLSARSDGL